MPEYNGDTNGDVLPIYESRPPAWLPMVHHSADLGYLGFYPPHTGQEEDILSEANIKNGFILGHQVSAETFSAHAIIHGDLSSHAILSKLEALMNEIFIRRAENIPTIASSTFRIPTRVTLNDSKRQAWFADLANPDVPLYKLGKSVPHGAKGHDLLDLLQSNNVAIPRAVWFLRVFGANETAGLRSKPAYNPTQYSTDWANVVTGYMKKQLADIALPSAPRPGLNIKQTFKGVLSEGDSRERWISRFVYCLKLLRTFYSEGLVDNRTFLVWLVQQMMTCNLAQTGFITRLADEYMDGVTGNRPLTRPFLDACLSKISEIRSTSAQEYLCDTEALLKTLIQRLCIVSPDAFISPRMWKAHSLLLTDLLNESITEQPADIHLERNSRDLCQLLRDNLLDIKHRNEAMLFRNPPIHISTYLGSVVSDIKLLNSISSVTEIGAVHFFPRPIDDTAHFNDKLDMLLTWCVTPLQFGDHRPFAAVTLIRNWRAQAGERATRRDFNSPDELLQDRLFDWLDSSEVAGDPANIRAVSLLFGKMVKYELFSYAYYIQRLIARGEEGLSFTEEVESRHRRFLRWIPLSKSTSSLISQRRVTLYGARARAMPEDANERMIRREIRAVLYDVFGGEPHIHVASTSTLLNSCNTLMTSTRFEQVRTFRQWLLPVLEKHIACRGIGGGVESGDPTLLKTYSISVELMTYAKCFHCILDLTLCLLQHSTTIDLLMAVVDTLHRFASIWTCMDAIGMIVPALDKAYQVWKSRRIPRPLLSLLLELDAGKHLSHVSRERITTDITEFNSALRPTTEHLDVVPAVLPEILLLAGDPNVNAPSILCRRLWMKYKKSADWAWKVWDNTVASLRQVPVMTSDKEGQRACALRYGDFLWHVDQHLALGLDDQVLEWFSGPGKNEIQALGAEAWNVLIVVLLYLSVHGALKTTTILQGLVYPAWQLGANATTFAQSTVIITLLRSANEVCRRLLLSEDIDNNVPPMDLFDLQCIRTRRQDVYCGPHFPLLASNIPLLICMEHNEYISEELRADSMSLRRLISLNQDFRQGAYRNLSAIREAFELSLHRLNEPTGLLNRYIVAGLRMLLCDISDNPELSEWPTVTSLLSPWKIAATMVQMQLILKQMGQELIHDPGNPVAHADLDRLILMLFQHSMSSAEAFYVGEMARGVDSVVAGKFINNGLRCITEMLQECDEIAQNRQVFQRAGETLRVMVYVAEPFREKATPLPPVELPIQEAFVEALSSILASMECPSQSLDFPELDSHDMTHLILILRLLQFELGVRSVWSTKTQEATEKVTSSLFKLAMIHGSFVHTNTIVYPLLIDTLYYIYDEIPIDTKVSPYDPFRNYPDAAMSNLPSTLPLEHRKQLLSLLPLLDAPASVSHMVNSHRDAAGNMVFGTPVTNRPWEWIENLGEPVALDLKDEEREREGKERLESKFIVKNSGSLTLETFGARLTGDGVHQKTVQEVDSRKESNFRGFEDGLSSENLFKRDWFETRIESEVDMTAGSSSGRSRAEWDQDAGGTFIAALKPDRRTTSRGSPASSVVSRSSARGSGSSVRQSPQGSISKSSLATASDIIDVDSTSASTSKRPLMKRKASTLTVSDDEIEIINGPVPLQTRSKIKPTAKAKPRKK